MDGIRFMSLDGDIPTAVGSLALLPATECQEQRWLQQHPCSIS